MLVGFNQLALASAHQQKQTQKTAIEQENKARYADVYSHELAHKAAAGSFGGAINIDKNAEGLITGGHVDILMPTLDLKNPEKTKNHAQIVFRAAMAPGDPSSQDYKVAFKARSIENAADKAIYDNKVGKKLDLIG